MGSLIETSEKKTMRIWPKIAVISFLAAMIICIGGQAHAQASLAAEDIVDEVNVTFRGAPQSYTLVRDATRREQWYYVPTQPRLVEHQVGTATEPEFTLIRYQVADPSNPAKLIEGGMLQFALTFAAPDVLDQMRDFLQKRVGGTTSDFRLSALPLKAAEVHIYAPVDHLLVGSASLGEGIAPIFSTQKMVFSIPLTKAGADVYDTLANGQTGVPVAIVFTFEGLTPAAGFSVKVNWDRTFDYYSQNSKFRAQASYFGWFGGSYSSDASTIRQTLIDNNCIEVDVISDPSFTLDKLDGYLQPILKRINDELVQAFQPPEQIAPAVADAPSASGFFGSVGYSVAMKSVTNQKHGSETIDMRFRSIVERKTGAGGFVGIGAYPDAVRKSLVTVVPPGPWQSAYFLTPAVADDPQLGVNEVDLTVELLANKNFSSAQALTWRPDGGWKDKDSQPRSVLAFPLAGIGVTSPSQIQFREVAQITRKSDVLTVTRDVTPQFGDNTISTPLALVDVVRFDPDYLTFKAREPASPLLSVDVTVSSGGLMRAGAIRPYKNNGVWQDPSPFIWMIERNTISPPPPITAKVLFQLEDGQAVPWDENGFDLREKHPSLDVLLLDRGWKKQ